MFRNLNLTQIIIVCAGVGVGVKIVTILANAPLPIIGIALLVDAIICIYFFRVNWPYYWGTLPNRAQNSFWFIKEHIWKAVIFGSITSILFWYSSTLPNGGDKLLVEMVGIAFLLITAIYVGMPLLWALIALLNNPEHAPNGRLEVEGQDVHGAADFATEKSVHDALKGTNAPAPTPTKFPD